MHGRDSYLAGIIAHFAKLCHILIFLVLCKVGILNQLKFIIFKTE